MGKLFLGTSGWSYRDWLGPFYPEGMPATRWFSHYCRHFKTVELNVTFYRIPTAKAVENWRDASPAGFRFAVKMNRQITHIRKLKDVKASLARFDEAIGRLGKKLDIVLVQLPPSLAFDRERFRDFVALLRDRHPDRRYALEFRHPSWFTDEVIGLLHEQAMTLCIADSGGPFPPYEMVDAPYAYVRFHGPQGRHDVKYEDEELAAAAEPIARWLPKRDVYVYFNNDTHGYGIENAFTLMEQMNPARAGRLAG